jgi:glycosyltransferase involved in cell wall biosynthesis
MAVVVLSLGDSAGAADAVRSLLAQEPRPEIVVVNTGGTGIASRLAAAGLSVPAIERAEPLFVGAARNIGINATRAPIVAFLAADCRAEPGWVAARLAAHRAGAPAVASALTNSHPKSAVAWAAHLASFSARLPGLRPIDGIAYGASYRRELFAAHGLFREDLRTGEDTEFNGRLRAADKPLWSSDVRTAHLTPTRLGEALHLQHRRGRLWAEAQTALGLTPDRRGFRLWYSRIRFSLRNSRRACRGTPDWRKVQLSWAILPFLQAAFVIGAHRQGFPDFRRKASVLPPAAAPSAAAKPSPEADLQR